MMVYTWVARRWGQVRAHRSRPVSARRTALLLAIEALERRLAPSVTGPVGPHLTARPPVASRAEKFLGNPLSQRDSARRAGTPAASALEVGPPLNQYVGVNQQGL